MREKHLRIAGIPIVLRSDHAEFWRCAERRYENFFDGEAGEPAETIEHRVKGDVDIPYSELAWTSIDIRETNGTTVMVRGNVMGEWDRGRGHCRVVQHESDFQRPGIYREYGCDSILRVMLSCHLLEHGGLFVHSAGLVRNGKGYLFVGESGAGKSTLTRASAPTCTVLSDDVTFARIGADGATVAGTPFFGDLAAGGANVTVPLVGIYFLHKAPANKVVPISARAALPEFLRQVTLFRKNRRSLQVALDLAWAFCTRVPVYELHFLPDDSFWSCIDDEQESATE
jgi:hypothetical protein